MADFMFQNVAYRATVYRTGVVAKGKRKKKIHSLQISVDFEIIQFRGQFSVHKKFLIHPLPPMYQNMYK